VQLAVFTDELIGAFVKDPQRRHLPLLLKVRKLLAPLAQLLEEADSQVY
jgi:hypothetical protein